MPTSFNLSEAAAVAAAGISLDMQVANTFRRDFDSAVAGIGKGRTVDYQIPGVVSAFVRNIDDVTNPVAVASLEEGAVPVTLTDHIGSVVALSEGQVALDLKNFTAQVLSPQAEAVAFDIESKAIAALEAEPLRTGYVYDAAKPKALLVKQRAALRGRGVADGMTINFVVGTSVYADLINADALDGEALKGVANTRVIESNRIASDLSYAYVSDAFVTLVRVPAPMEGAGKSAEGKTKDGDFGVRYLMDYDSNVLAERSVVSTFAEVAALPLVVKGAGADRAAGKATLIVGGGVEAVDTAV
ncbi:P22 coat protein Gp5 [Humibacillus xanthopallidus]|uniref:P22 coat protein Gp5 n=1 Tax=Humibacillus xanthopallidus TaxID=412689 RepID=A0A543PV12_9MICO|nr:P22 phage major capsid protein family protein [Humibacillus xanthopallidus]TQN47927.1 P22 coat protein Gp5 [Humibacillus xanthopallidus]